MATANETSTYQFRVYEDKAKEWRWQLVADNGKLVADSGEGLRHEGQLQTRCPDGSSQHRQCHCR